MRQIEYHARPVINVQDFGAFRFFYLDLRHRSTNLENTLALQLPMSDSEVFHNLELRVPTLTSFDRYDLSW